MKGFCAKNKFTALLHHSPFWSRILWDEAGLTLCIPIWNQLIFIAFWALINQLKSNPLSPHSGAAADGDGSIPWMQPMNGRGNWMRENVIFFLILIKGEQNIVKFKLVIDGFTFWDIDQIINVKKNCSDLSLNKLMTKWGGKEENEKYSAM